MKKIAYNLNPSSNFDIEWDNLESQKNTQKFIKQMDGKFYFQIN
jgi:isocitrate lyase